MGSQIFKLSPPISENPKFRSYSWSANVCGKKRWILISPVKVILCLAATFTCNNTKSCVHNISVSETNVPGFSKAIWLECIQEPNEIIFVPSGWYHQVHNLEDRISINHNWFNAYNLHWVLSGTLLQWDWLLREYYEAKEYIEDIKDICDLKVSANATLAANTGT